MGASYVAIGDHDLTLDEILRLPIRFAPLVFTMEEHRAAVGVAIEPVAEPPPPLGEAKLWIIDNVRGHSAVIVGARSFTVQPHGPKLYGFLTDLQLRAEVRRVSRAVAEVLGARRLVFCTDFNSNYDWDLIERGDRVQDVLVFLTRDQRQRPARWDETWSEAAYLSHDFNPPFFLDEWAQCRTPGDK
jgi:hypothetical protein